MSKSAIATVTPINLLTMFATVSSTIDAAQIAAPKMIIEAIAIVSVFIILTLIGMLAISQPQQEWTK